MNYNKYEVLVNSDIDAIISEVNTFISKGCSPLGGLTVSHLNRNFMPSDSVVLYFQTIIAPEKYYFFKDSENKLRLREG